MKCILVCVKRLWSAFFEMVKRYINLLCTIILDQDNPSASPSPSAGLAPTLSSISVDRGEQESTVPITLTGTNFTSDYYPLPDGQTDIAVNIDGTGVTVLRFKVVSSTTLTCDFVISQTAENSQRNVTVSHTGGTSAPQTFTVGFPSDFLVFFR